MGEMAMGVVLPANARMRLRRQPLGLARWRREGSKPPPAEEGAGAGGVDGISDAPQLLQQSVADGEVPLEEAQQRFAVRAVAVLPLGEDGRVVLAGRLPSLLVPVADGRGVGNGRALSAESRRPSHDVLIALLALFWPRISTAVRCWCFLKVRVLASKL